MKIKYPFKTVENTIKKLCNNDYKIMLDGEIAINSPFVGDTTYDCRINIDKQVFYDFESEEGGGIEKLIAELAGVDREEARNILLSNGKFEYNNEPVKKVEKKKVSPIEMPGGVFGFGKNDNKGSIGNFNKAVSFLRSKGVNYKLAKKYSLKWTESTFLSTKNKKINLSKRIIIPTYENNNLVYFQARDYTGESNLRYKNPPKELQSKTTVLPFYDKILNKEILFVSEGPWEAIHFSGTYMLGPGLSDEQIEKIKIKNPKAIYMIPDNDATGRYKIAKNINLVRQYMDCPIYVVKWWKGFEEYKDPIDAGLTFDNLADFEYIRATDSIELKLKLGSI